MSFDPNLYSGQGETYMSCDFPELDAFSGLEDNEDSIDISNLLHDEAVTDDFFSNIFPVITESEIKKEIGCNEKEIDSYHQYISDNKQKPPAYPSACSSASTSPSTLSYHNFNTSPLTTQQQPEKSLLRHHLQINGHRLNGGNMSTNQYSLMQDTDDLVQQQRYDTRCMSLVQQGGPDDMSSANDLSPKSNDYVIKQEEPEMPLALTNHDRTKQPLSSNLNMSNKRSSQQQSEAQRAKKSKTIAKGTPEYLQKRERNNVAVRRSRDKAKRKALETQEKVQKLSEDNKMLREEVKNLTNEVNTLKSLLQNLSQYPNVKT